MTAEFRVLGTLEVTARGQAIGLPAGQVHAVLAGLLLHANESVSVEQIARWLWDGSPPSPGRAAQAVHLVVARLRKALGEANVVATAANGYVALVRPDQLDLLRFRELVASGAHAEALSLWRGPLLPDVVSDSLHREEIARLAAEHRRLTASVPHQLPAANPHFVGREPELAALSAAGPVVVVTGTAGVGKTTLAVRWCQAVADLFPGGQLHVNLRGFDPRGEPARPEDVLRGFLDALGVPAGQLPSTVDERAALFRSLLAGRKMLVLLDNARDANQVRLLLPESPDCLVVVTSRDQLTGLGHPITLTTLTPDQSVAVLARHLGHDRVQAEAGAVHDVVARCAGLPLALAVVAARAATTSFPLRELADELADARLDVLSEDDSTTNVRAVFSWSYRQLSPAAARLFRLLGGRVVDVHSAAALAGTDVRDALAELERAQLVSETAGRFGCHDLLSAYAAELPEPGREAALDRLLDYYLHCADIADGLMPLPRADTDFQLRHRPAETPPLDTPEDAMAWFDAELTNVVNAVDTAPTHAHQLAQTLSRYLWLRADWLTWLRVCTVALPSTEGLPEPRLRTLFNISAAHHRMGDFDEALRWIERALPVSTEVSPNAHALALSSMGHALLEQQRYDEAEQCYREAALEADQPGTEAVIRHNLAILLGRVGRFEEAEREFSEAFPLYEKADHHIGVIDCHCNVAEMQLSRGELAEALDSARIALDLAQAHGSRKLEATSLELIGDALGSTAHWEQALAIYEELQEPEADRVRAKVQAERKV